MSAKSKKLGSLADIFESEVLEGTVRKIRLSKITPSEIQPRSERLKGVDELAESLRVDGLLQPILVTKDSDDSYKIIAGERRFHAANRLGWTEIECKIFNKNEKETYKLAVIENLQREDLSPYEEIDAMTILKDKFSYTDQELATLFGKSRSYMTEILSVSSLQKKDLEACKEAGIDNKNLLVQAVQASKRGDFQNFLDNVKAGTVRTVKDAKTFNKTRQEDSRSKSSPSPTPKEETDIRIQKLEKSIVLQFENPETLEITYKRLLSIFNLK